MYITRVRLKGIRGFRDLDLRICDEHGEPRMRTAIIGVNGTGKTTLLRCIAMGLCGQADANALLSELPGSIITSGKKYAEIVIDVVDPSVSNSLQTIKTIINALDSHEVVKTQDLFFVKKVTPFVVGYGIMATIGGDTDIRPYRVLDSVYTLFNYSAELTSAEITLRRLRDYLGTGYYKKTLVEIKKALGLSPKVRIRMPKGGGVEISGPSIGRWIPLGSLADGYQITFTWILDLYAWAMRAKVVTKTGGIKGVLLIDELEKNLHPSLQTNVLPRLQKLWPDLQIIGTTHSPLVTLGAHPREVVVLRREGDTIFANDSTPNFTGYSVEDMLSDVEIFDTGIYSPETDAILDKYKELAEKDIETLEPGEKKQLKLLAQELRNQQILRVKEGPTQQDFQQLRKDLGLGGST